MIIKTYRFLTPSFLFRSFLFYQNQWLSVSDSPTLTKCKMATLGVVLTSWIQMFGWQNTTSEVLQENSIDSLQVSEKIMI